MTASDYYDVVVVLHAGIVTSMGVCGKGPWVVNIFLGGMVTPLRGSHESVSVTGVAPLGLFF